MSLFFKARAVSLIVFLCVTMVRADMVVTPWIPIFKGVDRAVATNFPTTTFVNNGVFYTDSALQVAHCVRVDLTDPDVQLFPTPRAANYVANSSETYSISVSNFIKKYGVQVASAANFYNTSQGTDPNLEGLPAQVFGLSISTGAVVSASDFGPDSNNRWASMLFTTNKTAFMVLNNSPPGTNTAGIYSAFSGYYAVLTNGVIIGGAALTPTYPDPTFHQLQPRTLFGLSADRRYFYMLIIDGRQPGYSDGANDDHMGIWLLQFGASDGIAMDGGGSTAMYMADCSGNPQPMGHSSYVGGPQRRERITGSQLGIYALPLPAFVNDIVSIPGSVTATLTWTTISNATTQLEYGLTPSLGAFSPLDSTLSTNHSVALSGLNSGTRYYYRVLSVYGGVEYSSSCATFSFTTTNYAGGTLLPLSANWRYTTNNLDGANWQAASYDDSGWSNGPACLWADNRNGASLINYTNLVPNFSSGTRMPLEGAYPFATYYFRTAFVYSNT
ncbi:MAG TPA: phosphodiester glycosidase family protein, partial [Candidatus Limnocylindria bacterium]|nr:phosphodiester glycosidase family protein [Candidatus Limnocylindria bacterium]